MALYFYRICSIVFFAIALMACGGCMDSGVRGGAGPQIHFFNADKWINGPFGSIYFEGEYHLFYPCNTNGANARATHLGHAVSVDMLHWRHLPEAIGPDSLGSIFSGCVVADTHNTSGFGSVENPPLVVIFTCHDYAKEMSGESVVKTQGIAYSADRGRSWIKYDQNPVLPNAEFIDFNDPKVFMHDASQRWVMVLAAGGAVRFYTSTDLKEWEYASTFGSTLIGEGEVWESPDLFCIRVEDSGEDKWVLIVSSNYGGETGWKTQYLTGEFDGKAFSSPQPTTFCLDFGEDNYAATTVSNMPDSRRILIGWMNNWNYAAQVPSKTWRGATTIPRELKLHKMQDYYLLSANPVKEMKSLYGSNVTIAGVDVKQERGDSEGLVDLSGKIHFQILPSDVCIRFKTADRWRMGFAEKFGIKLSNKQGEFIKVGYDNYHNGFYADRQKAVQKPFSNHFAGLHFLPYDINDAAVVDMRIILDHSSMELFAMDGKPVITDSFFPSSKFNILEVFAENGIITVESISVTQLKSTYKNK